jgi:hypothetical protein
LKKIRRLKKAGDKGSVESNPKIESVPKLDSLSALGMQSFQQFDIV